jgi:hypothetical protein
MAVVQGGLQAHARGRFVLQSGRGPRHPARARGVLRTVERLAAAGHYDWRAVRQEWDDAARFVLFVEEIAPQRERRCRAEARDLLREHVDRIALVLCPPAVGIEAGEGTEEVMAAAPRAIERQDAPGQPAGSGFEARERSGATDRLRKVVDGARDPAAAVQR